MNFFKSKIISWSAITLAFSVLLFVFISYLPSFSTQLRDNSVEINAIIYSDNYHLDLTKQERKWLNAHSILRLGIDRDFPPFGDITEENKYVGFSADYMRLIEYRLGIKFDIKKNASWGRTIDLAKLGHLDLISAIVNTKERQGFLEFSEPYVKYPTSIFNLVKTNGSINSLKELNGKVVAIEEKSYAAIEIKQKYPRIKLLLFDDTSSALKSVFDGEADAYVGNKAVANYLIQKNGYYDLAVSGATEFFSTHSIGIIKPNSVLKSILDKTLHSIAKEDKEALVNYWFGLNPDLFLPKKVVHIAGVLLSISLLIFAFWSRGLSKTKNELKRNQKILKAQSEVDHLTSLGNRRKFYRQLDVEVKKDRPFALLFLDLDMFKEVNESFGHNIGDLLLIEASRRISMGVGELGSVARIGSDEFMIILRDLSGKKAIKHSVDFIRNRLSETFFIKGVQIKITTSVGIAQFPQDGSDAEELVKNVDQSMIYSKKRGRNCYSYFNRAMQREAQYKLNLVKDLRFAVANKQFSLSYQPIVDLRTNTITKAESLIRWNHEERGFVSPAEFIPLAEEVGLINEIGEWVFKGSVDQTVKILNKFNGDFQMTVNTSPLQYHKNGMNVSSWFDYLECRGLSGQNLVVEITEGIMMETTQSVIDNLFQLRDLNIRVAIDDFGTGYSSLSYLKKLDVDFLKIDQSFVTNLRAESDEYIIVEAIIMMAHKLGIKVIAEGVETELQRNLIIKAGCDYGQGFYFSKPLPADKFLNLLENWDEVSFHKSSQKQFQFKGVSQGSC